MSSQMTKLMRRLASADLKPEFSVAVERNQYRAVTNCYEESADTPEAAITGAIDRAIAAKKGYNYHATRNA